MTNINKPSTAFNAHQFDMSIFRKANMAINTNDNAFANELVGDIEKEVGAYAAEIILKMESHNWELI